MRFHLWGGDMKKTTLLLLCISLVAVAACDELTAYYDSGTYGVNTYG